MDFVREAAISDMFEIESSKLALLRSDSATKDFATQMIGDHSKTTAELKSAARTANIPLPTVLDGSLRVKLDKLRGLDGTAFTRQYLDDQVARIRMRYRSSNDTAGAETTPQLKHGPCRRCRTCSITSIWLPPSISRSNVEGRDWRPLCETHSSELLRSATTSLCAIAKSN
jgi:hypothetical protein